MILLRGFFGCRHPNASDLLDTLYPSIDTIEEDVVAACTELARLLIRRIGGDTPEALQTLSEPQAHWRD